MPLKLAQNKRTTESSSRIKLARGVLLSTLLLSMCNMSLNSSCVAASISNTFGSVKERIVLAKKEKAADDKIPAESEKSSADSSDKQSKTQDTFGDVQSRAYVLVMDGKYAEAKDTVSAALKGKLEANERTELLYLLAAIQYQADQYPSALANLLEVEKARGNSATTRSSALLERRIGSCYWGMRKSAEAISYYKKSLDIISKLNPSDPLIPLLLESITGSYVYAKDYKNAEEYGKQFLAAAEKQAQSDDLDALGALFWARIQMANIYRNTNNDASREKMAAEILPMLERFLKLISNFQKKGGDDEVRLLRETFEEKYINEFHPETSADYLWLANEFRMRSLPLIHWGPDDSAKAAILCIHGLGLDNRAFSDFGKTMAQKGYSVYAMDVRGFGSWQSAQGQEDVQFSESIKDIQSMLNVIHKREPNIPVFLLGESMGGAIALRGAAAYGSQLAGVISSVPSAELFQQRRMGFAVAAHLLQGKNRPFRVGDMITEQATSNQALSDKWKQDSKAKMEMSPKELIKFAVFMRSTKKECELIKKTPTFVVQGLKDRLVKPEGTVQLFEAVPCEDKNLLIVGTAEHLMFETFTPSKLLIDALTTWIDDHSKVTAKP